MDHIVFRKTRRAGRPDAGTRQPATSPGRGCRNNQTHGALRFHQGRGIQDDPVQHASVNQAAVFHLGLEIA